MAAEIHTVELENVTLSVTSEGSGPLVVLLHGFPDVGYTWRHQISALTEAGFRVIAPDMRGYGWSDTPKSVEAYNIMELVGDVIGLLDHEGAEDAIVIGHDWGAIIAPQVALFRPDRVRALALLSVPYQVRTGVSIVDHLRATDPEGPFSYMLAFQSEGVEDLFDADPLGSLRSMFWSTAGDRPENFERGDETPAGLPPHLKEGEMENYFRAFARTGFAGGINYYRNLHRNWELTRPWHGAKLRLPTMFLAGSRDFVATTGDGRLGSDVASMAEQTCADHRGSFIIEGGGHWVHQEYPETVNQHLVEFCQSI